MDEPIRVFVSYSGDDWEIFVKPFASQLLENGINAVVANWDIQPGQSLVRRIFQDELPHAKAIVIVLSKTSITKPWVLEEMDHAVVRRIEQSIKLIPVRIDDCEIPSQLGTIKRISYRTGEEWPSKGFESRTREVVEAIYNYSSKPKLGETPSYISENPSIFPELNPTEGTVLKILLEQALSNGHLEVGSSEIEASTASMGLDASQVSKAFARLEARGAIKISGGLGGGYLSVKIEPLIAALYCRQQVQGYVDYQKSVAIQLLELDPGESLPAIKPSNLPEVAHDVALRELELEGLIRVRRYLGGNNLIDHPSPFLEEWLEANQ